MNKRSKIMKENKEVGSGKTPLNKNRFSNDLNLSPMTALPGNLEIEENTTTILDLEYISDHLTGFNDLKESTALFGEEYEPIFKVLWYNLVSYLIRKSELSVGRLKPDGRISVIYIINSGRGKGELKRVQKEFVAYFGGKCREPTSLHAEQLVGKSIYDKKKKEHLERRGYLRGDFLIIDEAFNLLSSNELHYSEARKYIRTALDPFPNNTVCKQLTELGEDHVLEYEPECPINLFVQPMKFENDILVLEGDIRRFVPIYVNMGKNDKTNALERRVYDEATDTDSINKFCNEISTLEVFESFSMADNAKKRFVEHSTKLVERGDFHSAKMANFMEMMAFTLQNNLLKFSAVQAFQHGRAKIEVTDVELAFMDLFEIMDHAYEFIDLKVPGTLDYGDGWQGARLKDQEALSWLQEKGATSEKASKVSIKEYENKLREIYNVKSRQAAKYKNKHQSNGWIKSKKAPNVSKVWLNFEPESNPLPALHVTDAPHRAYKKIVEKYRHKKIPYSNNVAGNAPIASIDTSESRDFNHLHNEEGVG